jgi:hypothetical protein
VEGKNVVAPPPHPLDPQNKSMDPDGPVMITGSTGHAAEYPRLPKPYPFLLPAEALMCDLTIRSDRVLRRCLVQDRRLCSSSELLAVEKECAEIQDACRVDCFLASQEQLDRDYWREFHQFIFNTNLLIQRWIVPMWNLGRSKKETGL